MALLTDGTYGHSVDGSTLGLSLLKSGAWPDPHADEGAHRFRYALLPHAGTWQQADVPRAAFELGTPLRVVAGSGRRSLLHVEGNGVMAETVKIADDGDGTVVRLVESHNRPVIARLVVDRPLASAHADRPRRANPLDDLDGRRESGGGRASSARGDDREAAVDVDELGPSMSPARCPGQGLDALPYGVFVTGDRPHDPRVGVRIGHGVLDLSAAAAYVLPQRALLLQGPTLDPLMAAGPRCGPRCETR